MLNEIDLSRTDLNLLVLFEAVMEERHVGRTANRLHLSPSAVSHGLKRLRTLLNDPVFIRSPKGVVPTERANQLAVPIANILLQARQVIARSVRFDPTTTTRRFVIGAPDGISSVVMPPLLSAIGNHAPNIGVSFRNTDFTSVFSELDARTIDVALLPIDDIPARFASDLLYDEDFVIAMRQGNRSVDTLTLEDYCSSGHIVISLTGDPAGFVDDTLAEQGLVRNVKVTVPSVMHALSLLGNTDLLAALPRRLMKAHSSRFAVKYVEPPIPLADFRVRAVTPRAAENDEGLRWLLEMLQRTSAGP